MNTAPGTAADRPGHPGPKSPEEVMERIHHLAAADPTVRAQIEHLGGTQQPTERQIKGVAEFIERGQRPSRTGTETTISRHRVYPDGRQRVWPVWTTCLSCDPPTGHAAAGF